ncbi:MAG: carboxypeptidase-like regulatory domain-containing protein [Patiriisocius sp.]|uniref:carboxypeptidase-like regulatory domain-containing protein n=1 Tax=Patiriisocius sp. TaxID=2822396 RepID=UPI003EF14B6C
MGNFVYAQQVIIKGKLLNETDVEAVQVYNTTSRFNTTTDQNGNFEIEAFKNDTLVFSAVNYYTRRAVITDENYNYKNIDVTLVPILNELDEVYIGHRLTGDLAKDIKNVKTEDLFNFDDVGIPGFKGKPEEKIVPVMGGVITPTSVNIEALYKYLSGYYKNLKLLRKWQSQDAAVANILHGYMPGLLEDAFKIPENRAFDFVLFCVETTTLENEFKNENYELVLDIFQKKAPEYLEGLIME